jgi:4-carboxymuconolactone decarboxylase
MTHAPAPRLPSPRIAPIEPRDFDPAVREALGPMPDGQPVYNVLRTLAAYPALVKRLAPWGNHLLFKSSLPAREREIVILRTGWVCQAAYEWAHHCRIGLEEAGLKPADVDAVRAGRFPSPEDQGLIDAVDQLLSDRFIGEAVWTVLAARYTTQQLMDLVFTCGHYASICMALNTFGVQLEPGFQAGAEGAR